jgi:5-methylcytosine-specific restriction enzyme subunit McrC
MHPRVLTIREHEAVAIGAAWDPARRTAGPMVVSRLEQLQARCGVRYFDIGRRAIRASQWVGTITVGRCTIDVVPKINAEDEGECRARLVDMIKTAGLARLDSAGVADLSHRAGVLLDVFLLVYIRELAKEWRRGRPRRYVRRDADRGALRGKLLLAPQIRRNSLHPERFFTRADEFVVDTPMSRLLKAALHVCRRHAVSDAPRRAAIELLPEFAEVSDVPPKAALLASLKLDRLVTRFEPLAELARLLLSGSTPDRPGASPTYALMFDMNVVFERFIGNLMAKAVCPPSHRAHLQLGGRSLLHANGRGMFRLRPDIGILDGRQLVCLIDTKWKRLDHALPRHGVSQADVYQAYAYGKEYRCDRVILLYPATAQVRGAIGAYRHYPEGEASPCIEVRAIDVGLPAASRLAESVVGELRGMLDPCA